MFPFSSEKTVTVFSIHNTGGQVKIYVIAMSVHIAIVIKDQKNSKV